MTPAPITYNIRIRCPVGRRTRGDGPPGRTHTLCIRSPRPVESDADESATLEAVVTYLLPGWEYLSHEVAEDAAAD